VILLAVAAVPSLSGKTSTIKALYV
jgi:hypothetical protein